MRPKAFLRSLLALLLFSVLPSAASSSGADAQKARWLSGFAVGFRAGGSFFSEPTSGLRFLGGAAGGAEVDWGIFQQGPHRARLAAGFLIYSAERDKGTPEIRVETRYSRFDLAAGYDFTWKLLVVGAEVGFALAINRVETTYGAPTWWVEDGEIFYKPPEDPEVRERVGVDGGLLAGLNIGVEIGELFGVPDLLEIRAASDYTLRNGRSEITVLGLIMFWPTALIRK